MRRHELPGPPPVPGSRCPVVPHLYNQPKPEPTYSPSKHAHCQLSSSEAPESREGTGHFHQRVSSLDIVTAQQTLADCLDGGRKEDRKGGRNSAFSESQKREATQGHTVPMKSRIRIGTKSRALGSTENASPSTVLGRNRPRDTSSSSLRPPSNHFSSGNLGTNYSAFLSPRYQPTSFAELGFLSPATRELPDS